MKKTLITSVFSILLSIVGYSQNCKYGVNETDQFTKAEKKITEYQSVCNKYSSKEGTLNLSLSLGCIKKNNSVLRTIGVRYTERYGELFCADEKSTISLLLSNDSVVTFFTINNQLKCSELRLIDAGSTSVSEHTLFISFELIENYIPLLKANQVKAIRLNLRDRNITINVQEEAKKKLGGISFDGTKGYNGLNFFKDYLHCIE